VGQIGEVFAEHTQQQAFGGILGLGGGQSLLEPLHFLGQGAAQIFLRGWLAGDLFQTSAVVCANEEIDRIAFRFRFRREITQPAMDNLAVGGVEHGNTRLECDGAKVPGVVREVDANKSFSHGLAQRRGVREIVSQMDSACVTGRPGRGLRHLDPANRLRGTLVGHVV